MSITKHQLTLIVVILIGLIGAITPHIWLHAGIQHDSPTVKGAKIHRHLITKVVTLSPLSNQVPNACAPIAATQIPNIREFKVIEGSLNKIMLSMNGSQTASGTLVLREINADGQLGPELRAWVQHYGPGVELNRNNAASSDILITCHPELYNSPELLAKHVFPTAHGKIAMQEEIRVNWWSNTIDHCIIVFPLSS